MRIKIIIIGLFVSFQAHSEFMASFGQTHNLEKTATAGQYVDRTPFAMRAGYRELDHTLFVEYNQFQSSEAFSQILISRTHHELLVWGRHQFMPEQIFQLYTQAAPGVQLEHVQTNFFSETQDDTSKPVLALAAAAGAAVEYQRFRLELEARILTSAFSNPNPSFGVGLFGGYFF